MTFLVTDDKSAIATAIASILIVLGYTLRSYFAHMKEKH